MKENIENKILKLAEKSANKKINEEKKRIEDKLKNEIDDVKFILDLINKKMLYKAIRVNYNIKQYQLITDEIFLEDYFEKEPKSTWGKKLQVKNKEYWDSDSYNLEIEVNGEKYYHIGYIINSFETELKEKKNRVKYLNDKLWEIEKDFDDFIKQEPIIKKMIEDYYETKKTINQENTGD